MKPPHDRDISRFSLKMKELARGALGEDVFLGDATTSAVLEKDLFITGRIVACEACVVAGVEEAVTVLGDGVCVVKVREGGRIGKGDVVLVVNARASLVLARIRTALNYLSYLSGLATNARRLEKRFGKNRIAALRKTHPGLGISEKRALQIGGVMPHRINLGDGILVKKEHLALLQKETGFDRLETVREAVRRAKKYVGAGRGFVEIEVENIDEASEAAKEGPDAILLDNMKVAEVAASTRSIKQINKRIIIEASGGVKEDLVSSYIKAGADLVSGSFVFEAKPVNFRFVLF